MFITPTIWEGENLNPYVELMACDLKTNEVINPVKRKSELV